MRGTAATGSPGAILRSEHVEVRRSGERALLADSIGRSAQQLDPVATSIVERLGAPTTLATVCERIAAEFDVEPEECAATVERFVGELRRRGFVEEYDAPQAEIVTRRRYLDLLARALVNLIYPEHALRMEHLLKHGPSGDGIADQRLLRDIRYDDVEAFEGLLEAKREGHVWRGRPQPDAHTMVGLRRLENLERCAARVFAGGVPGDFLEAGVCQGGASIFLRALQVAYDEPQRRTWVADSFEGLPEPTHPEDVKLGLDFSESKQPWLAASLRAVQDNFRTYDLLSDAVRFVPGWFSETLAALPVERLAILRLDADLYESTQDVLQALYDRVSPGGYVVVDDYWAFEPCRLAVDGFLAERAPGVELRRIDWTGVFWRKTA